MILLEVLDEAFFGNGVEREEPDTTKLRYILMALIENGQRHDGVQGHGHDPPKLGVHPCARHDKRRSEVYCRYLFPRKLRQFMPGENQGVVE